MKKISMILGSALMMLTGCTTDTTKEVATNDNKVVIDLSADATRTSLGDKNADSAYPVLWSAGDKIAVNGIASEPLAAEYDGKTHAQFTVTGVAAPYNVIYPAEVLQPDGSVKISEIQEYVAGSFAQGAAVMAGHYDTPEGEIKNLYGFIKVTILKGDADKIIKSITLHSNDLEAMAGTFTIDYVNAALEPLSGMDFVKVTAADGIPFVDGKAEVVIAVPAGTYAKGFSIIITSTDGMTTKKSAYNSGKTIEASTLLEMPDITFNPTKTITEITDAAQLQAFLNAASAGAGAYDNFKNVNGEVLLGSDIDLTGVTLTSATQFDGVFNGQGYAIKNWKSDGVALFAANSGTIKNVVLDESCELNLPTEIGGDFGFIVSTNNNMVSGCTNNADVKLLNGSFSAAANMGILVGYSPDAHVQNCINNGDLQISATGNAAGTCYIGTVQGRLAAKDADTEISNCINNGNISITITDDTTSKNFYIGGVTGASNSGTKTTGCINHGDITFTTESSGAAVIIGGVTSYSAQAITDCFNSGAITLISKSQIKGTLIGGIAGYQHGAIKGCENTGDIELSATHFGGRNTIGDLDGTASTSTACNGMGGVVGQGTATFSMDNCKNSGNIKAYYSNMASSTLTSAGRFVYGGLVGDAWGDISNSDNAGSLNVVMTSADGSFTGKNAGATMLAGGIAGSGYYSKNQTELNITNCHNTGDLYMRSDNTHTTNHTCGGIVGWPGKESGCTAVTKDCSNTGNVTVEGNIKARVGGIQGGSGRVENCINRGIISANCAAASAIGGIAGFHSYKEYQMSNCENYGNVISQKSDIFAAGLIGQFGNVNNQLTTACKVNCTVQTPANSIAGMLVASFNGNGNDKTGEKYVISIGTENAPCQVAGKLIIGSTETTITAAELTKQYMFGASAYQNDHDLFVTLLQ